MDTSKSPFDDPQLPGKGESATSDPSSATGIFGTVSHRPISQQDDDLLKSLMGAQSSPVPAAESAKPSPPKTSEEQPQTLVVPPTSAPAVAKSDSPGEFTQIFQVPQTLPAQASGTTPAPAPTPSPVAAKASDDLANVFTQVVVEKTS